MIERYPSIRILVNIIGSSKFDNTTVIIYLIPLFYLNIVRSPTYELYSVTKYLLPAGC